MRGTVGIADGEGADTHETVGQSPCFHELLHLRVGDHLVDAVDPARAQTNGVGGKHHRAKDEAAVLDIVGIVVRGKDIDLCRSTVERI